MRTFNHSELFEQGREGDDGVWDKGSSKEGLNAVCQNGKRRKRRWARRCVSTVNASRSRKRRGEARVWAGEGREAGGSRSDGGVWTALRHGMGQRARPCPSSRTGNIGLKGG
eukprot:751957-Hanusia_phi.AAC.8